MAITAQSPLLSRSPVGLTGAQLVLRALEAEGAELCFGMPGGAVLPLYDALARGSALRHVLVRHEQGAGHMAQGYARATGRPGVVFTTSGPGATNLVTPIADAQLDSTPLVCITGQVRTSLIGTDAFQECDIVGVTVPLVKHSWQVRDVAELEDVVRTAYRLAASGRPGPVLVDVPRDVQEAVLGEPRTVALPERATPPDSGPLLDAAAEAIAVAARPVLYVGGGAQGCSASVRELADVADLPVVTTLMGKGAFPDSHPRFVGWPGMHGTRAANLALHDADLIVAAGARFDDRVTGRVDAFAPGARVVHIDVDPYEHGKIRHADVALHGDLGEVLGELSARLARRTAATRAPWFEQLADWKQRFPLRRPAAREGEMLMAQDVLAWISGATAALPDVIWTTGVGQHQMWAMQHVIVERPRSFVTSGGLGTMGFGLPAAIGAQLARPSATVVCIDGDGSFQMTLQELATAVAERLPIIVAIINNGHLGMVNQWQFMFYDGRRFASNTSAGMPDFPAIARGFGAEGHAVRTLEELESAFAQALTAEGPVVLDIHVDRNEACYPMILPGGAASEQIEWVDPDA